MRNKYTNDMKDISKILRRPLGGRGGVNAGQSSHSEVGIISGLGGNLVIRLVCVTFALRLKKIQRDILHRMIWYL